jgi:hypothetical protein
VFKPRESLQFALTVIGPGEAPDVFRAAVLPPLLETLPPLAVQPPTVTGTLSGLVQVQLMVEDVPARTVDGSAEHETAGGFFGGSFTVKLAMQLVSPPFLILGSEIWAVTV